MCGFDISGKEFYQDTRRLGEGNQRTVEFGLLPGTACLTDTRVRGLALERCCTLPRVVRKTWPIPGFEHQVAIDRNWAHSGKGLRYDEPRGENDKESVVPMGGIAHWCRCELNISNAWRCDRHGLLLAAITKTYP